MIPPFISKIKQEYLGDRTLTANTACAFILKVSAQALSFIFLILLARYLSPTQFGIYAFVWSWIQILSILTRFGMDNSASRFIGVYSANDTTSGTGHFTYFATRFITAISIFTALAGAVTVYLWPGLSDDMRMTFYAGFLILPLWTYMMYAQACLRAIKRVLAGLMPDFALRTGLQVILLGLCMAAGLQATAFTGMVVTLLSVFIAAIAALAFMQDQSLSVRAEDSHRGNEIREWLNYGLVMALIAGGSILLRNIDIIMLGSLTSQEETGLYAVASRIANLVPFALIAANFVIAPLISGLYSRGEFSRLQAVLRQSSLLISGVSLAASLALLLLAPFILNLFGQAYIAAQTALFILLGGQLINALCGSVGYVMTMSGHHKPAALIFLVTLGINIGLNALLIPAYGLNGAAIATSVSIIFWNLLQLLYVIRRLNLNPSIFSLRSGGSNATT